jgi:hypothetical protein
LRKINETLSLFVDFLYDERRFSKSDMLAFIATRRPTIVDMILEAEVNIEYREPEPPNGVDAKSLRLRVCNAFKDMMRYGDPELAR